MYISYEEYKTFGGKLNNTDFNRFCFRAECEINNATFGRVKSLEQVPEQVKRCEFELTEYLSKFARDGSASAVSSFGNDGYSVSYTEEKTAQAQIGDIIYTYLADSDLLYCGVG